MGSSWVEVAWFHQVATAAGQSIGRKGGSVIEHWANGDQLTFIQHTDNIPHITLVGYFSKHLLFGSVYNIDQSAAV